MFRNRDFYYSHAAANRLVRWNEVAKDRVAELALFVVCIILRFRSIFKSQEARDYWKLVKDFAYYAFMAILGIGVFKYCCSNSL